MRSAISRLAIAAAVVLSSVSPALAGVPRIGQPAPVVSAQTLDGELIDIAGARGKVVVVNIWATWCPPCRAEMPMLDGFYRQRRRDGLILLALSADRPREEKAVRTAVQAFAFPVALLAKAKVNAIGSPRVLPITYVIDRNGIVRGIFGLGGEAMTEKALSEIVDPLLRSDR